jgi:hypothetical protein
LKEFLLGVIQCLRGSMVEHQSCKLTIMGSIPIGGFFIHIPIHLD